MKGLQRLSLAEQAALHMEREIEAGRWKGKFPSIAQLSRDLGISKIKVQEAVVLLEARGLIVSQGSRKHREIVQGRVSLGFSRTLRVGVLLYEDLVYSSPVIREVLLSLKHHLEALGHGVFFAPKSQLSLGADVGRIRNMIEQHQVDAWIVCQGSIQLLHWFREQTLSFISMNGVPHQAAMAADLSVPEDIFRETVQRLITLGHKRIVWVCSPHWIRPEPIRMVRDFQEQLLSSGISAGSYNAPYYDGTPDGFQVLLHSLFHLTPPTALIVPCQNHALAAMGFLTRRKLRVPEDVSLVACSPGAVFHWMNPKISHFHYDSNLLVRRIVRWVERCVKGTPDLENETMNAVFVAGETIACPPRE